MANNYLTRGHYRRCRGTTSKICRTRRRPIEGPLYRMARAGIHTFSTMLLAIGLAVSMPASAHTVGTPVAIDTKGDQARAQTARAPSGASVIVWAAPATRARLTEIFARRYDANGQPIGLPFQVNQQDRLRQNNPRVAIAADGAFIVAWLSEAGADGLQVIARRFTPEGQPVGPEFRVDRDDPTVITVGLGLAMNAQGEAVVTYTKRRILLPAVYIRTVRGQRISADGTLGKEFRAALTPLPNLRNPAVCITPSGDFVIAWRSDGDVKVTTHIYARRFHANGRPYGVLPQHVSQRSDQATAYGAPAVVASPDNGFTVAWTGYGADARPLSVFIRRFDADDKPVGDTRQVGSGLIQPAIAVDGHGQLSLVAAGPGILFYRFGPDGHMLTHRQVEARPDRVLQPSIGVDSDGRSLISWQDFGRDGDGIGVFTTHDVETSTAPPVADPPGSDGPPAATPAE